MGTLVIDPMHYLRKERDRLIKVTDWEMMKANETGVGVDKLKTYRQKLRDLTSSADPKWTSEDGLTNVTWPPKP